jgi:uncharacterized membrane protein
MARKAATRMTWGRVIAVLAVGLIIVGLAVAVAGLGLTSPSLGQWLRSSEANS